MDYIDLNNSLHNFEKQNSISLKDSKGFYDVYKCKYCGLTGKRYGLSESLLVDITLKKVKECDGKRNLKVIGVDTAKDDSKSSLYKVKIVRPICVFGGKNLQVGSIVDVVEITNSGVWVKGEPVTEELLKKDPSYKGILLLLNGEFEKI